MDGSHPRLGSGKAKSVIGQGGKEFECKGQCSFLTDSPRHWDKEERNMVNAGRMA